MINGGNKPLKEYFTLVGVYLMQKDMAWKYKTKAASYYREKV
jgi:hypothetical protein